MSIDKKNLLESFFFSVGRKSVGSVSLEKLKINYVWPYIESQGWTLKTMVLQKKKIFFANQVYEWHLTTQTQEYWCLKGNLCLHLFHWPKLLKMHLRPSQNHWFLGALSGPQTFNGGARRPSTFPVAFSEEILFSLSHVWINELTIS